MERLTSSWRLPAPVALVLSIGLASCQRAQPQPEAQPHPTLAATPPVAAAAPVLPPERPMTKEEDDARQGVLRLLDDPKLNVVAPEARPQSPSATQALESTFAALDPTLKTHLDLSRPVKCVRNGCSKDVVYDDWATFHAVNQAVLFGRHQSPFVRYPGGQYRTGRSPEKGGKFVVTWALMYPLKEGGAK
jgi:hypothetical protein